MPTTCDGCDGFSDLILSEVLTRLPPMMRSYSRPSWGRTLAIAARMRRAFSSFRKSKNGSVTNGPAWRLVRGRTGASSVAMGEVLSKRMNAVYELGLVYTSKSRGDDGGEDPRFDRGRGVYDPAMSRITSDDR